MKNVIRIALVVAVLALVGGTRPAHAGTQDFVLVNQTGVAINNLHISETAKDDWEEDVLGDQVLENGESIEITFAGNDACLWDLMVEDADGDGLYWRKINLCEVARVVLHCDETKCWATFD